MTHYHLKPDKNNMLNCPFHEDKTPSMQIYPKSNTYCCFSGNCKAGTGDVIQFIELKEDCSKHEAIVKAKSLLGVAQPTITNKEPSSPTYNRTTVLEKVFCYFEVALLNSKPAKDYLKNRGLEKLLTSENYRVGYHTGSFHLGSQNDKELIQAYVSLGLLRQAGTIYQSFGLGALVFPLLNKEDKITGLYFRMVEPPPKKLQRKNPQKHLYLKDRQGLYPAYPKQETKSIILTESIIDAATLLQQKEITQDYEILGLYGTNGLTTEHVHTIQQLEELKEIILWLDGDEAGKKATKKHGKYLQELLPAIKITVVETPEGEDINSLLDGHTPSVLLELLQQRKLFSSSEKITKTIPLPPKTGLNTANTDYITYQKGGLKCTLLGGISLQQIDRLRVTLLVERSPKLSPLHSIRQSGLDLYNDSFVEKFCRTAAEKLETTASARL